MASDRALVTTTRAEYVSDAVVHVAGLVLATGAVPALILLAALLGQGGAVAGVSIYGATLLLMVLASALYNMYVAERWTGLLHRLDHSAIYLKIAGTYTGFGLIVGQGAGLLTALWGLAAAGISLKFAAPGRFRILGLALYLAMGWAGAAAGRSLLGALPAATLVLIAVGGALYSLGVVFFLWEKLPYHNTIWHVFVLVASIAFYAAMVVAVALA